MELVYSDVLNHPFVKEMEIVDKELGIDIDTTCSDEEIKEGLEVLERMKNNKDDILALLKIAGIEVK